VGGERVKGARGGVCNGVGSQVGFERWSQRFVDGALRTKVEGAVGGRGGGVGGVGNMLREDWARGFRVESLGSVAGRDVAADEWVRAGLIGGVGGKTQGRVAPRPMPRMGRESRGRRKARRRTGFKRGDRLRC